MKKEFAMKLSLLFAVLMLLPSTMVFAQATQPLPKPVPGETVDRKAAFERASYGIGSQIGTDLKTRDLEVDLRMLMTGLKDAFEGAELKFTEAQLNAAFEVFSKEMATKRAEKARLVGDKNKKEGAAFLAANKLKPGVKTLPSGLQYLSLKAGKGASPKATDNVSAHYHGTLIDGTVFDSSVERGEPLEIAVNGVIRGWTEALQLMKVGDKWRLFVPSELAYGENGAGPDIGPNAVLIFEVELLSVQPR